MIYRLDKASNPGFTLETDHIEWIRWALEENVCDACKLTEKEYKQSAHEVDAEFPDDVGEGINPYTLNEFKPETYKSFSDIEKVEWLLTTACGCEFWFEETEDVQS